jgi:hypothetical protein
MEPQTPLTVLEIPADLLTAVEWTCSRPSYGSSPRIEWLAQVDDFRTFLADFVSSLPQVDRYRVEAIAD